MKDIIGNFIIMATLFGAASAVAQVTDLPPGVASPFQSQRGDSRGDELYSAGTKAMDSGDWKTALDNFSQVIKAGGKRVDAAIYWQAYAQNKLGERNEALTSIGQLKREFPRSQWLKDASALELEIQQSMGRSPSVEQQPDCELKILAVNSLMNSDPERAEPILEKLLSKTSSDECTGKIEDKALFVLSQSDSTRARELMTQIASGKFHPELQSKAIHYLGVNGNHKALMDVYNSTGSNEAKKAVLHSLGISGACRELSDLMKSEKNTDLMKEALHSMGIAGCRSEMRAMYNSGQDASVKHEILRSTIISGDTELQEKVATSDPDPQMRMEAIKDLGISGGSSQTLVNIYNTDKERKVREAVMNGLFVKGDAHSLVDLARKENDPELKKAIVQKLSVMGNREATDYLMELLNK
jgi:tetratricopeptide (TPR) repeat protein